MWDMPSKVAFTLALLMFCSGEHRTSAPVAAFTYPYPRCRKVHGEPHGSCERSMPSPGFPNQKESEQDCPPQKQWPSGNCDGVFCSVPAPGGGVAPSDSSLGAVLGLRRGALPRVPSLCRVLAPFVSGSS